MLRIVPDLCRGVCGALRLHNPYERQPMRIKLQTADTSHLRAYPYYVSLDGMVGRQDLWKGTPTQVIGFSRRLDDHVVDVVWHKSVDSLMRDPSQVVGMYVVMTDKDGQFYTPHGAIVSAEVVED